MANCKENAITFSPMLEASVRKEIKTETRRPVLGLPVSHMRYDGLDHEDERFHWMEKLKDGEPTEDYIKVKSPYGQYGHKLWVREMHYRYGRWIADGKTKTGKIKWRFQETTPEVLYQETAPTEYRISMDKTNPGKEQWYKRLARFMPRVAARTWLEVTDIRIEKLNNISQIEAINEGIPAAPSGGFQSFEIIHSGPHKGKPHPHAAVPNKNPKISFIELWESIYGKDSWALDPWVWVIKFKKINNK